MQKLIFAESEKGGGIDTSDVAELLSDGWKIIKIIPQSVGISVTYSSSNYEVYGGMLFLLEKDEFVKF